MALEVHAVRSGSETRMRVWDTRLKGYRTGSMPPGRMLRTLAQLAHVGGLHPTTERSSALVRMIDRAESGPLDAWKPGIDLQGDLHNALRHVRLGYELARQLTEDLFDLNVDTFLTTVSEDARRFLARTFILHELTRGSGRAVLVPRDGQDAERAGYRDKAHALELVEQLRPLAHWIAIETKDTGRDGSCLITFTLL